MYTVDGLRNGIQGCKNNIKTLESAIEKERQTIVSYKAMIDSIESAAAQLAEAEGGVHIEIVK